MAAVTLPLPLFGTTANVSLKSLRVRMNWLVKGLCIAQITTTTVTNSIAAFESDNIIIVLIHLTEKFDTQTKNF